MSRTLSSTFTLASLALALGSPAAAQQLPFTLNPASALDVSTTFELRLPGTLIGDFDAVSNPTGTRTLPGLFGGSGNQPISIQLDLIGSLDVAAPATGAFAVRADSEAGTVEFDGLAVQLASSGAAATLSLRLTYPTFRTFAPNSLFPSLIPLELPIGQATIGDITLAQLGPVIGTLVPTATVGVFDVTATVAATLTFEFDFNGQITPVGPLPVLLPITAVLDLAACDASLTGGALAATNQTLPSPAPFELTDLPFPLPTILPPGGTANLLLTVALDEIAFDAGVDLTVDAGAPAAARIERYCDLTPNSAGLGAVIDASGATSVTANNLVFDVVGLPSNVFGFFVASKVEAYTPNLGGGQGTLCITNPCLRFSEDIRFSGPGGAVTFQPNLAALPMGVAVLPGESWRFQYWYRDSNPSTTSNLTEALRILFCE